MFDLDGTLIDSAPGIAEALNQTLAEDGRRALTLAAVTRLIGDGAEVLVARAFAATGPALGDAEVKFRLARFVALYEPKAARTTRAYPGVAETLARLRDDGWRLGVCTNKPSGPTREVLHGLGLEDSFDAVVGASPATARKPDPGPLMAVLEALGAGPGEAVMVGDAENDVRAARAAGVPIICVTYGYARSPPEALGADALIDRLEALPEALAKLD